MINLYKFHSSPESLDHHDVAHDKLVEIFWDKYKNNPEELKKREKAIALSTEYSYKYARYVLEGSFKLGEAAIAKDAYYSCLYAYFILEGPFKLGEAVIAENSHYSYDYASSVLEADFYFNGKLIAKI